MGNEVLDDSLRKIHDEVDCLIEFLKWYKTYLVDEIISPQDNSHDNYLSRNKDTFVDIKSLRITLHRLNECYLSGDYSLNEKERYVKALWARMLLRETGTL